MSSKLLMLYGLEWHGVWLTKRDYFYKIIGFDFLYNQLASAISRVREAWKMMKSDVYL